MKEVERARAIYKYALDHLPKAQAEVLYQRFVAFEKQHGDREGIEDVVLSKRRFQYEADVKKDPLNYDAWFDYIKLEESTGDADRIREVRWGQVVLFGFGGGGKGGQVPSPQSCKSENSSACIATGCYISCALMAETGWAGLPVDPIISIAAKTLLTAGIVPGTHCLCRCMSGL